MSQTISTLIEMMSTFLKRSRRIVAEGNLAGKVIRGGVWLGAGSVAEQTFRFARNMVLTRLLAPEAFGLMAIILSISSAIDAFTEIGVKEAIVQNPRAQEDGYVNSAWWISLLRAVVLYALIFVSAPWIARFYRNSEITALMRCALLAIIFAGAMSSRAFVALKEMKFKRWAIITHAGGICGAAISVTLAFFIRGVWALAIGFASESFVRCVISHAICPFRPKLDIDKHSAKDLLTFSKRAFGLSFLNLVFARIDVFVIAKLYSAAALGIYSMAIYLVQVPTGFVMSLLGQILMPTFSQMQDDDRRINRLLSRITSAVVLLLLPALILVVVSGRTLLGLFYGGRYGSAYLPLVIAAFVALINLVNAQLTTVFYALGHPHLHRRCVAVMALCMMALIYPFVKYFGMAGGQVAALTSVLIGYITQVIQIRQLTGFRLAGHRKTFMFAGAASLGVLAILTALHGTALVLAPISNIAFGILVAGLALTLGSAALFQEIERSS